MSAAGGRDGHALSADSAVGGARSELGTRTSRQPRARPAIVRSNSATVPRQSNLPRWRRAPDAGNCALRGVAPMLGLVRSTMAAVIFGLASLPPALAGPALLYDATTRQVLYAEDADHPWYPASLTKLM